MQRDERGLAIGIIGFFAIITVAALFYILADPAAVKIFDFSASATSHQEAKDAIQLRRKIWGAVLYFILFLAFVFITGRAVFESRRP